MLVLFVVPCLELKCKDGLYKYGDQDCLSAEECHAQRLNYRAYRELGMCTYM